MIQQVSPSVSSFSEHVELFPDFHHIFIGPSDIIPLAISDVRPPKKKLIYLFILSLGVLPSEFVALHLPEMHDETHKQVTICNNKYKFVIYSHSILQEYIVKNVVMVVIHSESLRGSPSRL